MASESEGIQISTVHSSEPTMTASQLKLRYRHFQRGLNLLMIMIITLMGIFIPSRLARMLYLAAALVLIIFGLVSEMCYRDNDVGIYSDWFTILWALDRLMWIVFAAATLVAIIALSQPGE